MKALHKLLLWDANYDYKNNNYTMYVVHIVLNGVIFRQILYDIVPYTRYFLPVKFIPKY